MVREANDLEMLGMSTELVRAGVSVDQARDNGCTPLYIASEYGHLEVVNELVRAGASVDQAKDIGSTPL